MNGLQLEHPPRERLAAFGLGQLSESELAEVESHLAECEACRAAVEGVADDTFIGLLRSVDTEPDGAGCKPPAADGTATEANAAAGEPDADLPAALADHPRYHVQELLGVGGMGVVYRAEHRLMERPVALKVIHAGLIDRPAAGERFRREVRAAARLAHPNIVTAFDAEQAGEVHFLVMEYVEGLSLARLVAERGPLPVAEACAYIRQAALGLAHAHECGMVHRDIKPQNLMRTPTGQIKILDFGLARFVIESVPTGARPAQEVGSPVVASDEKPAEALTQTGTVMGTPDYLAPEQTCDAHAADIRADIYSLGCTLYCLLSGAAPFPEGSAADKLKAHRETTPKPLAECRRDLPPGLLRVIARMTAKRPEDRYQTPAEVADALALYLTAPPRRRKWLALAAAAGAFALVAGVLIYVQTDRGRLVIDTNDDQIAVLIENGGVKVIDQSNHREYQLRPGEQDLRSGEYKIEVTDAAAGLDFDVKQFTLKRGKEVRIQASFERKGIGGTVVQKKASTGLDADAFNWFPADCTFWAARDLRVQAGLSDEQLLILVQLLGDAGWRDRIWKLKSVVGRIDRIAAAYAPDPARFFVRLSGRINHDRLIDAFRTEFPFAHVQGEGSPMIGTITTISGLPSPAPVVALVNDSDLLLGGYVAADGPSAAVVAQMLNVRAGRYRRGRPAIPPHVWGVIVGEPPEPVRRLVTALTPLRLLPKKVSVSLNGDKTTELRLEATFATPADARSFADGLRALQKRGLAFVQDPPPPLYFTRGTAMLLDEALRTLTVGRDESTVNGEMRIRDQAFAALTDALRNLPLSALRPLLSGLKTVGEAAGRKAARERLAVLKQIAAETEKRFRAGLATADSLIKAKLDVCKAELELCESDKERVDVHERTVVLIRELENVLERHHRAGVVPQTAVLKAKADLLEAEAALERAKAAVGK